MCLYLTVMCPSIDFEVSPPPSCVITVSLAAPFFFLPTAASAHRRPSTVFDLILSSSHSFSHSHACLSSREWLRTSARWVPHASICMVSPPTPTRTCRPQNSVPGGSCPTKTAATLAVRLQQSLLMTCNKALWEFFHFRVVVKWPNCAI